VHHDFFSPPAINEIKNNTIKMKNRTFAMEAAPTAIPVKPKIAAIIAITRKITVQRNIVKNFRLLKKFVSQACHRFELIVKGNFCAIAKRIE